MEAHIALLDILATVRARLCIPFDPLDCPLEVWITVLLGVVVLLASLALMPWHAVLVAHLKRALATLNPWAAAIVVQVAIPTAWAKTPFEHGVLTQMLKRQVVVVSGIGLVSQTSYMRTRCLVRHSLLKCFALGIQFDLSVIQQPTATWPWTRQPVAALPPVLL